MSSPTTLIATGLRAMIANQAALQTTGHNIANAGVEGYSRQRAEFTTLSPQTTARGFIGRGVQVETVSRVHSAFLTREAAATRSLAGMDDARHQALKQIEAVFPVGETGVGHVVGSFLNAVSDLASRPGDAAARQVVLARAGDAAARFAAADEQLDAIQGHLAERLAETASRINDLARSIATVNQKIAASGAPGHTPNDLLDERDRLVASLSDHVKVSTMEAADGTLGVFIGGGQRLVLGDSAAVLRAIPDPEDPSRTAISVDDGDFVRTLPWSHLGGGGLAGILAAQNQDLVAARAQIGRIAAVFAETVNRQQSLGLDMGNPAAAGAPIFATGGAVAVPHDANQRDPGGAFVAQVTLAIADATQLAASEYELRADPAGAPGAWQLTRRADGLVRTVADGDTVDGFTLSLGTPAPASTDRFLLKPVSLAPDGMRVVLGDPRGVAAAAPVTATVATTNTGSASVASLVVTSPAIDPEQTATIAFTSAAGDYAWELRDRASGTLLDSGTGSWTGGSPIELNGFALGLDGAPRSGDVFTVARTAYPGANNGNALALALLRDQDVVGQVPQATGGLGGGQTFGEAYAAAMADIGVRVQSARVGAEVSASTAGAAELARSSLSGVSLDEEAARLLAFQQSYQAAAKVLQIAQSVFDTLLDSTRT